MPRNDIPTKAHRLDVADGPSPKLASYKILRDGEGPWKLASSIRDTSPVIGFGKRHLFAK